MIHQSIFCSTFSRIYLLLCSEKHKVSLPRPAVVQVPATQSERKEVIELDKRLGQSMLKAQTAELFFSLSILSAQVP